MKSSFQSPYFHGYLFCLVIALVSLLFLEYGDAVLIINSQRSEALDNIMPWMTYIGDGIFFAILALILIVYRWRIGVFFAVSGVIQAAVTAILKRIVFGKVPRPTKYFEDQGLSLELIPGIDNATVFSFPSGHTMTVFMMTALFCFTIVPKKYHLVLLFTAILGGFSRIYLLQHFLLDVVAGSVVGVLMAAMLTATLYPKLVLKK